MKVLLIEDDETASEYLHKALSESGHVVDAVGDGLEGLNRAMQEPYDALIVTACCPPSMVFP